MIELDQLWNQTLPPALYHLSVRRNAEHFCIEATERGFHCFYFSGSDVIDKPTFLAACAEAMQFPAHFGKNWDALNDSIQDLSWVPAPRYILFFDRADIFAADHPSDWAIARSILRDAVAYWKQHDVPFYVFLRGRAASEGLPRYP